MSAEHLSPQNVDAMVDTELSSTELATAQEHVRSCHSCSLRVLEAHQLKGAVRQNARRFNPPADVMARLSSTAKQAPPRAARVIPIRSAVWASIAAALLVALILGGWKKSNEQTVLATNLLDQHLAALADTSAPQVISTDRHTVKPWFQGKLPFSFNLPDASDLPAETTLQGADLTYVDGKPAALLLFAIHKHRASVFLAQGSKEVVPEFRSSRSGFNLSYSHASGLDLRGVSDVNRTELDALVDKLAKVQ